MPHFHHADLLAMAAASIITLMVVGVFGRQLEAFEKATIDRFALLTTHRRWFTIWVLAFPLWCTTRAAIMGYVDWDGDITALLWSGAPFFVENIIKATQGQTLQLISDLTIAIRAEQDKSKAREEATLVVINRVLDAITEPGGGETHG